MFAKVWKEAGADPALQSLVKDGHKIIFDDGPPPCTLPLPCYETKLPEQKMNIIRAEVGKLLAKGAIRKVPSRKCVQTWAITPRSLLSRSLVANGGLLLT